MSVITEYFSGVVYCVKCKQAFTQYTLSCSNCKCKKPLNVYDSIMWFIKNKLPHVDIFTNDTQIFTDYKTDIVIPDYSLAIEILNKEVSDNQNYNLYKKIKINANGYKYLQIFEDEWFNKREIVEEYILYNLSIYNDNITADQCIIKLINKEVRNRFLTDNHLLGDCNSLIAFGAYYKSKLIGVLSGNIKGDTLSIKRFACIRNNKIDGLLNKMMRYIKEMILVNVIDVTIDLRFESGDTYKKAGFNKIEIIKPSHWFINRFDINDRHIKTPTNKQSNYICVWDCGKIKMKYK